MFTVEYAKPERAKYVMNKHSVCCDTGKTGAILSLVQNSLNFLIPLLYVLCVEEAKPCSKYR